MKTHITYEKAAFGVARKKIKKCNTRHYIALCYITFFPIKNVPRLMIPSIHNRTIQSIKIELSPQKNLSWQANFTFELKDM